MVQQYSGAASRAALQQLGGIFTPKETTVAVDTTAVAAVSSDPNRIALTVTNTGTTNITLSTNPSVISGVGLLLLGNGASMTLNWRDDADTVAAGFYAIGDLAGGSLHVFESVESFQMPKQGA